jgi:hypothetical protein
MRIAIILFCCLAFTAARAQGPSGYWLSEDKTGFFEGLDNVEMRLDPVESGFSGSIYYIWEHGIYYQAVSLEGTSLAADSVVLKEIALVANRNGVFPNDCRGTFRLCYSRDEHKEYLKGIWKKPAGSNFRYPDTHVTFFRAIPPDAAWAKPTGKAANKRSGIDLSKASANGTPATSAPVVVGPPPDPDSLRFVSFKSRKDSTELIIKHHEDSARLEFYDDAIVDHDRISLFLGDSIVLKNYELVKKAKTLTIYLRAGSKENVLSLYAENEGDIPPNTALMVIYIDDQRYEVRLSSDMRTNARVIFKKLR